MDDRPSLWTLRVSRRQVLGATLLVALAGKVSLTDIASAQAATTGLSPAAFKTLVASLSGLPAPSDEFLQAYRRALQGEAGPLEALYRDVDLAGGEGEAGPTELARLLREHPPVREAVAALLTTCYTGVVGGGTADAKVVTYTGALAWQALAYTNAPTFCGGAVGYWGSAPEGGADG